MQHIRFLHLPKTAGTTLSHLLHRNYYSHLPFELSGIEQVDRERFDSLTVKEKNTRKLFIGHASIITGVQQADDAQMITILRDPVARVKSYCQHVYEGKNGILAKYFPNKRFDLDEFLDCNDDDLSNLQTKLLVGRYNDHFKTLDRPASWSAMRDLALNNLFHKVAHFGLQEFFEESLTIFAAELNWYSVQCESKNVASKTTKLKFEQRHLDRIAELNRLDLEVYNVAKARFVQLLDNIEMYEAKLQRGQVFNMASYRVNKTIYKITRTVKKMFGEAA
jgi:hypothetical protein